MTSAGRLRKKISQLSKKRVGHRIAPQRDADGRADEHSDDEAEGDARQRGGDVAPELAGLGLAHHDVEDGHRAG